MNLILLACFFWIANMENIMQEALEITNLFKKSDKLFQYTNVEQIRQKFKKQTKHSPVDNETPQPEQQPVEIFLPKNSDLVDAIYSKIQHWSQNSVMQSIFEQQIFKGDEESMYQEFDIEFKDSLNMTNYIPSTDDHFLSLWEAKKFRKQRDQYLFTHLMQLVNKTIISQEGPNSMAKNMVKISIIDRPHAMFIYLLTDGIEAPSWLYYAVYCLLGGLATMITIVQIYSNKKLPLITLGLINIFFYYSSWTLETKNQRFLACLVHFISDYLTFIMFRNFIRSVSTNYQEVEINVFAERFRPGKTLASLVYVVALLSIQEQMCGGFHTECWFVFYVYNGYFYFRLFSFLEQYTPENLQTFPFFNIGSSALHLQIAHFCVSKNIELTPMLFSFSVTQYLHLTHVNCSMQQSICSPEDLNTYFDQIIIIYQRSSIKSFAFGDQKIRILLGFVFFNILSFNAYIFFFQLGKGFVEVAIYTYFELIWEFFMIQPHWARRKIIMYHTYLNKCLNQKTEIIESGERKALVFHYGVKLLLLLRFCYVQIT